MIDALVGTTGPWFLAAITLEFLAVAAEQMGAAWKPPGEEKRGEGFGGFALLVVTTLTPAMLLVHGFFLTVDGAQATRVAALGLVIGAVLVGAIGGRSLGAGWQGGARTARGLTLPLGLAAFALAIYVTHPSLGALVDLASGRAIQLPVRPI
jgi:hypothetical protein